MREPCYECGSERDEDGDPTCPRYCPCGTVTDGLLYTCPACDERGVATLHFPDPTE